jgi:hypothetical protein
LEVRITGHNFGRGPSKDWLQLAQWFLCILEKREDEIFKKSSLLKLLSQSQPNFAEMILGWSSSKIVSSISELRLAKFGCGGHLGRRAESPDTFLEENHPMTISSKSCCY